MPEYVMRYQIGATKNGTAPFKEMPFEAEDDTEARGILLDRFAMVSSAQEKNRRQAVLSGLYRKERENWVHVPLAQFLGI